MSLTSCSPRLDSGSTAGMTERYVPRWPGGGTNRCVSPGIGGAATSLLLITKYSPVSASTRATPGMLLSLRAKRSIALRSAVVSIPGT